MAMIHQWLKELNELVWGPPMLVMILGTGLILMLLLGFMPLRRLFMGLKLIWQDRKSVEGSPGVISPFQALMTTLAATVGIGNIAGVATAIAMGGPGALFWMWCTALVGMATKYAEVLLAVHYREKNANHEPVGGPMYAIKNGLGKRWLWLGGVFAFFGGFAGFGIGNMVQVNSMAQALEGTFSVAPWVTGIVTMVLVGLVILGGIRRIGRVAAWMVPFMCIGYVLTAMVVLVVFAREIPEALRLIVVHAFTPTAATGGFAGAAVIMAIRFGVARGIFSNEAGLGTGGIAQAAGASDSPVRSGMIGMSGTFIDTIIICSMTGLAIVASGAWTTGETGALLSATAFEAAMPGVGSIMIAVSLVVFAFTTILGWSYFGERCWEYLVGKRSILPFRICWVAAVFLGAVAELDFVWLLADTLNALMALPNLVSLLLLSPVVIKLTKDYFRQQQPMRSEMLK